MIKVSDVAVIARSVQMFFPISSSMEYYEGIHAGVEIIRLLVICLDCAQVESVQMSVALHCMGAEKCKNCPYDVLSFNQKAELIRRKAFQSMEVVEVWNGRI